MNKTKNRKLSTKMLKGVLLFAAIVMIFASVAIGIYYFTVNLSEVTGTAFSITRAGARMVDGDRIRDYLSVVSTDENGNNVYYSDAYYYEVMGFLNALQEESDLVLYYYICVPYEDSLFYIWDSTAADDSLKQGYIEKCNPSEEESVRLAFSREPEEKIALVFSRRWGNLLTAFTPIFDSSGEPVALVGVDLSLSKMLARFNGHLILILVLIMLMTFIGILFLIRILKRQVIMPIEKLNGAVKSVVGELRGKARFDFEIKTGDELEELANSFRSMDDDLHAYIEQLKTATAEQEHIHAELDIAKKIQADILPNVFPAFPERNDFDIYAVLYPCEEIGGDFYDFFLIDDDHLAMMVGDVSGFGVPTALYMVMVETLIKNRAMQSFTPADVLQSVSEQMLSYKTELFSLVWFAVLELSTGEGVAINAGYGYPVLRRADKRFELIEYQNFPPVGASEGVRFHDHGFQLYPGDSVFMFSNGLEKAKDRNGEIFGNERVLELLNRDPEATPSVLIQTVKQAFERFSEGGEIVDDLTMLALKYYGPNGSR